MGGVCYECDWHDAGTLDANAEFRHSGTPRIISALGFSPGTRGCGGVVGGAEGRPGYGRGKVLIWDRGTYDLEKWEDDKIVFELHGDRVVGRYALIRTDGKNWLLHKTR